MEGHIKINRQIIDKITYEVSTLDYKERDIVRHALYELDKLYSGVVPRSKLHAELQRLRHEHDISDIDLRNVERAFFD